MTVSLKWAWSQSHVLFKVWEISNITSETVQDSDAFTTDR